MGFDGVVISDGLGMKAIVDRLEEPGALATAVNAGLDLFLVVGDEVSIADAQRWATCIADARADGTIPDAAFHAACNRIDRLQETMATFEPTMLDAETFSKHEALAEELRERGDWDVFDLCLPGFE